MINTIKQNKKAVLAFLLALVMLIGLIPFTATEAYAMTIDATSGYITWENGDSFTLVLVSKNDPNKTETHKVTYDGANWSEIKSSILPAHAFAYIGDVNGIEYVNEQWNYDPVLWLDQRTADKFSAADVMIATGEATKEYSLALKFEHLYTKVTFNIEYASEFADTDKDTALTVSGGYIDVKAFVGETTAEVIIPPRTYTAGELFATVTVNGDTTLKVKAPEGFTFEAGTHYTFDLKVGKDKVTLTQVSAVTDFPGGWDEEKSLNYVGGIKDPGKTAWKENDAVFVSLDSEEYGLQTVQFNYQSGVWTPDSEVTFSYHKEETPTVTALYAPSYYLDGTVKLKNNMKPGMDEYIETTDCTIVDGEIVINFKDVERPYSRLRIATMPGAEITVKTTGFTPAGATEAGEHTYTLTADANGNAFLYGSFKIGATMEVTAVHEIYPTGGITKTHTFDRDWQIQAGGSYAFAVKLGDNADAMAALSGDIALSDGSFVPNSMIGSMTAEQKAAAVGIVFWTVVETDPTGRTYPASLTDDKVMNADFPQCTHGLIVSLKNLEAMQWQSSPASIADWQGQSAEFNPSTTDYVSIAQASASAEFNRIYGYQLTKVLQAYNAYCEANGNTGNIVNPVAALGEFSASNPAPLGSTGWYLPSVKELHMLCYKDVDDIANNYGTERKQIINSWLDLIGGDTLLDADYWSSTEQGGVSHADNSIGIDFATGDERYANKRMEFLIRFICAF